MWIIYILHIIYIYIYIYIYMGGVFIDRLVNIKKKLRLIGISLNMKKNLTVKAW